MDICKHVFGTSWADMTPEEQVDAQKVKRMASYYRHHALNVKALRESKRDRKLKIFQTLGIPPKCSRCGYDKYVGALDFHHRDPHTKIDGGLEKCSFEDALTEAQKCDVVCANCHRELHAHDKKQKKSTGRPRTVLPHLEAYMRATGCTAEMIANALASR